MFHLDGTVEGGFPQSWDQNPEILSVNEEPDTHSKECRTSGRSPARPWARPPSTSGRENNRTRGKRRRPRRTRRRRPPASSSTCREGLPTPSRDLGQHERQEQSYSRRPATEDLYWPWEEVGASASVVAMRERQQKPADRTWFLSTLPDVRSTRPIEPAGGVAGWGRLRRVLSDGWSCHPEE